METRLLEVENLSVSFGAGDTRIKAVDNVSFSIKKGESLGLVGESGAGKSVTALSIPRLVPSPPSIIENGRINFKGHDLVKLDVKKLRQLRGNSIGVVFQDPTTALSPLHRIGEQMVETIRMHRKLSKKQAWTIAEEWLAKVKIPDVKDRMFAYPYQLSGGMQQRVMIAMALMQEPSLIIADEPTTALDVTIQAQVFSLIKDMKKTDTSMLLITHDMGVVWEMCDRVIVMYASQIVEEGLLDDIFSKPAHPYTKGLLASIPKLGGGRHKRLLAISGQVPSALNYPLGCHFEERCPYSMEKCKSEKPPFVNLSGQHKASCFLLE